MKGDSIKYILLGESGVLWLAILLYIVHFMLLFMLYYLNPIVHYPDVLPMTHHIIGYSVILLLFSSCPKKVCRKMGGQISQLSQ